MLCLCSCTVNKWLHGTRHLGRCHGRAGVELVRKPGLTVGGGCVGSQVGHLSASWGHPLERALVPAVEVSGLGSVTAGESQEWADWEVSLTRTTTRVIL